MMEITLFPNRNINGPGAGQCREFNWPDITNLIHELPIFPEKARLPLVKLAKFIQDNRSNENVVVVYGLEGDYDGGAVTVEEAVARLQDAGVEALVYPSAGWTPQFPKWRVLLPLKMPLYRHDFDTWEALAEKRKEYLLILNGIVGGGLTPESVPLAQCFYFGYVEDGHREKYVRVEGRCIDELPHLVDKAMPILNAIGKEAGVEAIPQSDLTLDTVLERRGESKPLRDWLPELKEKGKLRDFAPFDRESESGKACFLRLTDQGTPILHDVGTGISHHLRDDQFAKLWESKSLRETAQHSNVVGRLTSIEDFAPPRMNLSVMKDKLVQITYMRMYAFKGKPHIRFDKGGMADLLRGNKTQVGVRNNGAPIIQDTFDAWHEDMERKQITTVTFHPGAPQITVNPPNSVLGPVSAMNLWSPVLFPAMQEDYVTQCWDVFHSHVNFLWGDRTDDFLVWLAHIQQKPGELAHTSWLHVSPYQGTGRSWLGNVLAMVFAPYVAPSVELPRLLNSDFNAELSSRLLAVVEEVNEGGSDRWKHAERFKSLMTDSVRQINQKHEKAVYEYNCCRWLMFSNHDTALPVNNEDRRVEVVRFGERPKDSDYYARLYGIAKDPMFAQAIGLRLSRMDISRFNPGAPAKTTRDKKVMVQSSQSVEERLLNTIVEHWPYDLISAGCVRAIFRRILGDTYNDSPRAFSGVMRHKGKDFEKVDADIRINDSRVSVYKIRNHLDWPCEWIKDNLPSLILPAEDQVAVFKRDGGLGGETGGQEEVYRGYIITEQYLAENFILSHIDEAEY